MTIKRRKDRHRRRKSKWQKMLDGLSPTSRACMLCDKPFTRREMVVILHIGENGELSAVCSTCTDEVRYHFESMDIERKLKVIKRLKAVPVPDY